MKRGFEVKQKAFFIILKERSVAKNCLRSQSAPLSHNYFLLNRSKFLFFISRHGITLRNPISKNILGLGCYIFHVVSWNQIIRDLDMIDNFH